MRFSHRLIERYVVAAVLPYLLLGLLLLTAVLLTQQAARFAEILGSTSTPFDLAADVLLGLLPNILLFTLPMAVVVGTATGFSRLGSDSELVAMKAAGVGNARIVAPVFLLGLLATGVTLYDGFGLAPEAARLLRQSAVRAALFKLESPVEPNAFNTELPGKIIYVREGDIAHGQWGRVFIHWQEAGQPTRIVTARTGRIDTSGEQSELVLGDAMVTTISAADAQTGAGARQIVTERSEQLRVRLNTGRDALIAKLQAAPRELDEMGWGELRAHIRNSQGAARRASLQALHKRLSLCCAPLALALLGAGLGVRVRRGGRGLGVLLSLAAMIVYYLCVLAGDQLGRSGSVPPAVGAWLPTALALLCGSVLLLMGGRGFGRGWWRGWRADRLRPPNGRQEVRRRAGRFALLGLLDRSILRALALSFGGALGALVSIFLIFTLFELLRYLSSTGAKFWLLLRYLFFLIPLAGTSIAPIAMLLAVIITYALLARRNEAVAWWAAGQSVYRLALPGVIFAAAVGGGLWLTQTHVLPQANRKQEALRAQIRNAASQATTETGRQWLALPESRRIYTYLYDNGTGTLVEPTVFEFDEAGVHIRRIVSGAQGAWDAVDGAVRIEQAQIVELSGQTAAGLRPAQAATLTEPVSAQAFKPVLNKPSELNTADLSRYIKTLKAQQGVELRAYEIALARRRADPFAPLVMALLGLPLALSFGRRTALAALSLAVGVGLAFWGSVSGSQQLGQYRLLPAEVAAWAPLLVFIAVGAYLLSRART